MSSTIKPKTDITAEWERTGRVLEVNEWGVEVAENGHRILRIGDGKNKFLDLHAVFDAENYEELMAQAVSATNTANTAAANADTARDNANAATAAALAAANTASIAAQANTNAVIEEVSGEVITMADSSDLALTGLKLFGKTTQDGEPSPENPVPLVSVGDGGVIHTTVAGKNLFGGDALADKLVEVAGATKDEEARTVEFRASNLGKQAVCSDGFKENTKYTVVLYGMNTNAEEKRSNLRIVYTDETATNLTFELAGTPSYCIQSTSDAKTIQELGGIYLASGTILYYDKCGIFEGVLTEADFEQYIGQSLTTQTPNGLPGIPVESGGNYTDANGQQWVCDEVDFARGVYVQRVYEKVLDGTESVFVSNNYELSMSISTKVINSDNTVNGMCSHYKAVTRNVLMNNRQTAGAMMFSANAGYIRFLDNENYFQDAEGFTAMLADQYAAGTPVTIKYILATPIETPLSAEEIAAFKALHSNKPNTTVYNDSGAHMAVEYIADTKTYIDNKFTELQNAILSAGANI